MNAELAKDASAGLRIEAVLLYLSGDTIHGASYDSVLLVGCSLSPPKYCVEGFLLLYVEESRGPEEGWIGKSMRGRRPFRLPSLNHDYLVCKGPCLNLRTCVQVVSNCVAVGRSPRM
jgi:hypothetical protein